MNTRASCSTLLYRIQRRLLAAALLTPVLALAQPIVESVTPADGASGVAVPTAVAVTFSQPMDAASLTAQTAAGACTGAIQVSADNFATCVPMAAPAAVVAGNTATVTPAPALAFGATYKVRVTTAATAGGVPIAATFTQAGGFATATDGECAAGLVISQVYGGGGSTLPTYASDFVEIHNRGTSAVSLAGHALQYGSATGTTWQVVALPSQSIPAGGYFLVRFSTGGSGAPLPTPDYTSSVALSASSGKLVLTSSTTGLSGACPVSAAIVDFVGYGTANCFEGGAAAPVLTATLAAVRPGAACVDTNSNNADFIAAAPAPRNSATAPDVCTCTLNERGTAAEMDYCNIQFPSSITVAAGASTPIVYAQVYEAGVTEAAGSDASMRAQVGYGPATVNPQNQPGYAWFDAPFNTQVGNNDEYAASFTAPPAPGAYRFAARFSRDGAAWTYCDLDGAGSGVGLAFSPTSLGVLAVEAAAGAPQITSASTTTFLIGSAGTFTVTATGSPAPTLSLTGALPSGVTFVPATGVLSGTPAEGTAGTYALTISAANGQLPDASQSFTLVVEPPVSRIHAVQGAGASSPLVGQLVAIEGIVTGSYQLTSQLRGFFVQEEDADTDGDPATSEAIFVLHDATVVAVGDKVRVIGSVTEFGTVSAANTQLASAVSVHVLASGQPLPAAVEVALPVATTAEWERYEGMRVTMPQSLTVTDNFYLGRYGELSLASGGRALQPTNAVDPNDEPATGTSSTGTGNVPAVLAAADLVARDRIRLDDGSDVQNPSAIPYLDPAENTVRVGSTVTGVAGIVWQALGTHRIIPQGALSWTYAPRPAAPPAIGSPNVKVAGFNLLNYFNGDGLGGGFPTTRGASSLAEFTRQRAKTLAALHALGADIVGLVELENDGSGPQSSHQDLVDGLNALAGPGTWALVPQPADYGTLPGGSDEIRVAFIYKPGVVALDGSAVGYNDAAFANARAPLAQAFRLLANDERLTVIVGHFKSKGSSGATGLDLDQGDGQGAYNESRRLQAAALAAFAAQQQAATGDPDVLLIGDFNAFEQEDPIDLLRAAGFASLTSGSHSFVIDGQSGTFDHALASPSLAARATGATHWHINADEPALLDYNTEFKPVDYYTATPYRSGDHDPVLAGFTLLPPDTTPDAFSFTSVAGAMPGAVQVSGAIVPSGFDTSTSISVAGGEYSLGCGGTFTGNTGMIAPGQSVCVRHSAPVALSAQATTTLTIGGVAGTFTSTTLAALPAGGDFDGDGIPNEVEANEGRNPLAKDNDIFSPGAGSARLFAMQMYRDFLNREGDEPGIAGWASLVDAGTYTRPQVIDAFLQSPEFGGFVAPVVRLYFATFLRVPDYAGLMVNAGLVRAGTVTPVQLADFFAASPEFLATYGALSDTQFVTLLYNNVLGRAPDPDGLSGWVALLGGGMTRGQVLYGFSESAEYQARMANEVLVTMMYAGMLRRTPEPDGFNGWVAFLDAGTYTREQVINGFFLSTEYRGRFLP